MKQHITIKQLNELSEKGRYKLEKWAESKYDSISGIFANIDGIVCPLLSIGQMIEFLSSQKELYYPIMQSDKDIYLETPYINGWNINTMCDELWEAVKEILEK